MTLSQRATAFPNPGGGFRILGRVVGPALAAAGLALMAVGAVSFAASLHRTTPPRYFWCVFAGIPMAALGVSLTLQRSDRDTAADPDAGPDSQPETGASASSETRFCPRCRAALPEGVHFCRECLDVPEDSARV